ncbi:MAG: alkaline phosphatase family protein [Mangrovibacterium sp.]
MKNIKSNRSGSIAVLLGIVLMISGCGLQEKHPKGIEHVVVIGLDGMSSQGLKDAHKPFMDSLMQNGAYSYKVRCVLPTVSKPNWNAMICGAGPEITGVTGNGWYRDKNDLAPVVLTENQSFPNIFRILREQRPEAEIGAIYHWGDFGNILDADMMNKSETWPSALETAQKTADYIREKKPDFLFIQLDDVDHYGHTAGHMSSAYLKSIEEADNYVRIIVNAIHHAGIAESTMIMVVADHGGIFKGHGGNSYEELTTPVIFTGKGIKKGYEIRQQVYMYDVAANVAFALGLKAPQQWTGRPTLAAYEGFEEPDNIWKGVELLPPPVFATTTYEPPLGGTSVDKPAEVNLSIPAGTQGVIRYTTDGSVPTRESAEYKGPFTVDSTTVVTAKLFNDKGESPKVTGQFTVTYTK